MTMLCEGPAYAIPPHMERWAGTLTTGEARVVQRIAQGMTNRQIAGELFVAEQTVKFHATNSFRKLGICSRDGRRGPSEVSSRTLAGRWWIEHVETAPDDRPDREPAELKALIRRLWSLRSSTATYQLTAGERAAVDAVLEEA